MMRSGGTADNSGHSIAAATAITATAPAKTIFHGRI
jgi:hypothetical protein